MAEWTVRPCSAWTDGPRSKPNWHHDRSLAIAWLALGDLVPTMAHCRPAAETSCAGPKPCGGGMLGVLNTRWAFRAMAAPWSWKVLGRSRCSHRRGGPLIYSIDYRAGGACRPRSAVLLRREKTSKRSEHLNIHFFRLRPALPVWGLEMFGCSDLLSVSAAAAPTRF